MKTLGTPNPMTTTPTPARARVRLRGTALAALVLLTAFAPACEKRRRGNPAGEAASTVAVRTAPVVDTTIARPVLGTGTLAAKEEVPLAFKLGGVIAKINVEPGQAVGAGTHLASLELPEIEASVEKARAAAEKAERDYGRARSLFADSVVTREVLEHAETGRAMAANDLKIALYNRLHASIEAPSAGVVLRKLAEPGQLVAPGTPVLLFGTSPKGEVVRLGLADRDIVSLKEGDPAEVVFDAYPDRTWTGRISRLGAAAAPGSGTYEAEVRLDEPVRSEKGAADLSSGLVGNVSIRPSHAEAVRLIPIVALIEGDDDRAVVWSIDPTGAPRRHEVRLAFLDRGRAAIRGGLDGVDRVVTDGAAYLTPASRVRVENGN